MAIDKEFRKELLKKFNASPQALSQRVKKMKKITLMSTADATYLIGHQLGVKVEKYLDQSQRSHLRGLQATVASLGKGSAPTKSHPITKPKTQENVIKLSSQSRISDPVLSKEKMQEAVEMAAIYPHLFVFENSLREVIKRVMNSKYGHDWWGKELTGGRVGNLRHNVDEKLKKEKKESWHQRRGSHPIDYLDLADLEIVLHAKQADFFPDIISDKDWFTQFMRELYPSRCVLCHMNPLDVTNIKDIYIKMEKWKKMIKANIGNIPTN